MGSEYLRNILLSIKKDNSTNHHLEITYGKSRSQIPRLQFAFHLNVYFNLQLKFICLYLSVLRNIFVCLTYYR